MRIVVVGAGGVGGFFGGRLAAAGADVTFIARGAHLAALRERGLRIRTGTGEERIPVRAVDDPAQASVADLVILAVKLWDTDDVVAQLAPLFDANTAVLSLQNGVTKDDVLRAAFGARNTIGALCYIAAKIAEPGVIEQTGALQKLVVGEFGGAPSPRLDTLGELCRRASIDVAISDDIERATWEKFVFLVGLSGATSVIRQPIGAIRADPHARALLADVFAETVAVGRACGARLGDGFAADRLAFCDTLPPAFSSSMHGDLERGNRLEMPWLQGVVVARGAEHGIPTPANAFVLRALSLYANGTPASVSA